MINKNNFSQKKISVVIPTYNEKENLHELFVRIFSSLDSNQWISEVIIVDDNSPDGTSDKAKEFSLQFDNRILIIQRKNKRGLATAVIEGIQKSNMSYIAVMDADLSHPPEILPKMLEKLIQTKSDFILGSRYNDNGQVKDWPFHRRLVSQLSRLLAKPFTNVSDPLSGLFAFRKDSIKTDNLFPLGYKIALEILTRYKNLKVTEISYTFCDRKFGKTKFNLSVAIQYLKHLYRLHRA